MLTLSTIEELMVLYEAWMELLQILSVKNDQRRTGSTGFQQTLIKFRIKEEQIDSEEENRVYRKMDL